MKISTDIDRLIELLKQRKKLPLSEASAVLKQDESLIYSWAEMLEEKNILEIKFELSKVFLNWKGGEETEIEGLKQMKIEQRAAEKLQPIAKKGIMKREEMRRIADSVERKLKELEKQLEEKKSRKEGIKWEIETTRKEEERLSAELERIRGEKSRIEQEIAIEKNSKGKRGRELSLMKALKAPKKQAGMDFEEGKGEEVETENAAQKTGMDNEKAKQEELEFIYELEKLRTERKKIEEEIVREKLDKTQKERELSEVLYSKQEELEELKKRMGEIEKDYEEQAKKGMELKSIKNKSIRLEEEISKEKRDLEEKEENLQKLIQEKERKIESLGRKLAHEEEMEQRLNGKTAQLEERVARKMELLEKSVAEKKEKRSRIMEELESSERMGKEIEARLKRIEKNLIAAGSKAKNAKSSQAKTNIETEEDDDYWGGGSSGGGGIPISAGVVEPLIENMPPPPPYIPTKESSYPFPKKPMQHDSTPQPTVLAKQKDSTNFQINSIKAIPQIQDKVKITLDTKPIPLLKKRFKTVPLVAPKTNGKPSSPSPITQEEKALPNLKKLPLPSKLPKPISPIKPIRPPFVPSEDMGEYEEPPEIEGLDEDAFDEFRQAKNELLKPSFQNNLPLQKPGILPKTGALMQEETVMIEDREVKEKREMLEKLRTAMKDLSAGDGGPSRITIGEEEERMELNNCLLLRITDVPNHESQLILSRMFKDFFSVIYDFRNNETYILTQGIPLPFVKEFIKPISIVPVKMRMWDVSNAKRLCAFPLPLKESSGLVRPKFSEFYSKAKGKNGYLIVGFIPDKLDNLIEEKKLYEQELDSYKIPFPKIVGKIDPFKSIIKRNDERKYIAEQLISMVEEAEKSKSPVYRVVFAFFGEQREELIGAFSSTYPSTEEENEKKELLSNGFQKNGGDLMSLVFASTFLFFPPKKAMLPPTQLGPPKAREELPFDRRVSFESRKPESAKSNGNDNPFQR